MTTKTKKTTAATTTTTAASTTKLADRLSAKAKTAKKGGKPLGYVADDTTASNTVKVWKNKNREGDEFIIPGCERFTTPLYISTISPKTTVKEVTDAVKGIVNDTTITVSVKDIGKMSDGRTLFGVLMTITDKGDEADVCLAFAKDAVIHGLYGTKLLVPVKDGMTVPTDKCPAKVKEVKTPKFEEPATETTTEPATEPETKKVPVRTIAEVEEEISNLYNGMETEAAKAASAAYNTFSKKVSDAETRTAFAKAELDSLEENRSNKVEEVTIAIVNLGLASNTAVMMANAAIDKELASLKAKVSSAEEAEAALKAERQAAADTAYDAYITEAHKHMEALEEELEKLQHEASLKALPAALAALGLSEAAIKAALAAESQN